MSPKYINFVKKDIDFKPLGQACIIVMLYYTKPHKPSATISGHKNLSCLYNVYANALMKLEATVGMKYNVFIRVQQTYSTAISFLRYYVKHLFLVMCFM